MKIDPCSHAGWKMGLVRFGE